MKTFKRFGKNFEFFETSIVDKTKPVEKEGMEITAFIAGVNSGMYEMPFCIQVRTWARKWWFKKFFYCEAKLNLEELKRLRNEFDKAIKFCEAAKSAGNKDWDR